MSLSPTNVKIINILAAYGIVQVLAQDLGLKTGKKQRDLVQSQPLQGLLLFSGAYVITQDEGSATLAVALYYFLKVILSRGKTATVCFEEV